MVLIDPSPLRALVSGFGPFSDYKENPSWLAVQPLHDTRLATDSGRPIHITTLELPVSYEYVLKNVPGLHKRPPVLPSSADASISIPEQGYDFIFHVGVSRRGPIRIERVGYKYGYNRMLPDATGQLGPIVKPAESPDTESVRGFGEGYEEFPEELSTDVDVPALVAHLQMEGLELGTSIDAGHYLCDFTLCTSLAISRKVSQEKPRPVLFMHVSVREEKVTDMVQRIVPWVCNGLS
ncbi:peptidase C15, pyroglutamyl peptidase I-like protein [Lentinus tigrinus ALCF2SS1-7]|uniref:peptidase C15, pyroglutamyl peptidase I-like protein n=1 Tax=Lentinus tigrinus ALCF2SS1-7 TaxID=1328758 RepID=UPI0011661AB7|nr:peptidase C15, pyroglutamyl peptidase I-like protein [Lentinus tigrinus ALCF2SS1-7]